MVVIVPFRGRFSGQRTSRRTCASITDRQYKKPRQPATSASARSPGDELLPAMRRAGAKIRRPFVTVRTKFSRRVASNHGSSGAIAEVNSFPFPSGMQSAQGGNCTYIGGIECERLADLSVMGDRRGRGRNGLNGQGSSAFLTKLTIFRLRTLRAVRVSWVGGGRVVPWPHYGSLRLANPITWPAELVCADASVASSPEAVRIFASL